MALPPDADDAAVVTLLVRVVAAAAVCLLAGGVGGVVRVRSAPAPSPAVLAPGQLRPAAASGGIGPVEGDDVADYVGRRRSALERASGRRAAVISFVGYRTVVDAAAAIGGTDVVRLLLALPGGPAVVMPPAPAGALADAASRLTVEAEELQALGDTTDDPAFKADYGFEARSRRSQAAAALDPHAEVVFAVVVVADAAGLATLAGAPGVRLVDAGTSASVPAGLRGLRPEEVATAGTPPLRPG